MVESGKVAQTWSGIVIFSFTLRHALPSNNASEVQNTNNGLPWLQEVPVVGLLFGARSRTFTHSEILVLITPRVIRGRDDGDAVTRELRDKLRLTIPVVHRR